MTLMLYSFQQRTGFYFMAPMIMYVFSCHGVTVLITVVFLS